MRESEKEKGRGRWGSMGGTLALLVSMSLAACGVGPIPGGELEGPEISLEAAGAGEAVTVIRLETRPEAPYSVRVQLFRVDGAYYLDPAPDRRWLSHIEVNPSIRIQFPGDPMVYRARAEKESRAEVLEAFDTDVVVLRLLPE